jgi:glycine cleavage system aminomethyltransferase T
MMTAKNLAQLLQTSRPVELLRNQQTGPNVYPGVPAEYTNWRDEQQAWQKTCVLFNQSYHMADLAVEGPDAFKLLSRLSMNSFQNFAPNKAKQFVPCSPDGYVIGDVILFYLAENKFNLVGRAPALNWVTYHAQTGKYDVKVELDQRSAMRADGRRKSFRFQIQGPLAMKVIEKLLGKTPPELKFFNMTPLTIAGKSVRALRHGMAGQPGWELFGPWDDGEAVREAVIKAGEEFGLSLVGGRAYSSNALESGWIPSPLPAVYTGEAMKAYREWLPAAGYEASASIGGSFYSDNIEDYYLTPYDLGYAGSVKFDHDFIGRAAMEKIAAGKPRRKKITLVWDGADVAKVVDSYFHKDPLPGKFMEWPSLVYAVLPYDKIVSGGKTVGISTFAGYSTNERALLSLAMIDTELSEPGTKVTLIWGEEGGGSSKPNVERHRQMEIHATVGPNPFATNARTQYRK